MEAIVIQAVKVISTVHYSTASDDRVPTPALASEPWGDEVAQLAYLRTPVSQVRCEGSEFATRLTNGSECDQQSCSIIIDHP
jgi:hypothetical protein